MRKLMKENPKFYDVSLLPDTYYRYFEVGVGHFITHGGSLNYANTYDFKKYSGMLAGAPDPSSNTAKIRSPQGNICCNSIDISFSMWLFPRLPA
jgi:hypothetical protein